MVEVSDAQSPQSVLKVGKKLPTRFGGKQRLTQTAV